ncbi:bMERB domain-containing protein 1-like isoform X2 [Hyperolius riggenbachi]|uniref:bMERB domain-containing protein 1-like isoform X2 n=1 Tax=Hyperolius riggenbachi TaxID=752182 RepID=UPI0035A3D3A5
MQSTLHKVHGHKLRGWRDTRTLTANTLKRNSSEHFTVGRMDDFHLCEEITRLKKDLQKLVSKPESEKTQAERQQEEAILQRISKLVETRDFLVDDVEFERLREREEDKEMAEFLQKKLSKSFLKKAVHRKEKATPVTSRAQQTNNPYVTKTGLTLVKECCGFTCSIM